MKGSRALTPHEIEAISACLASNRYPLRDRALFMLGIRSGFRISELLSLRVKDVIQNGNFVDRVSVARQYMKKKKEGRTVVLHAEAKKALKEWVQVLTAKYTDPESFVFRSRQGGNRPIGRRCAWRALVLAYEKCGLTGKLGTHCMRKTFAKRVYEKTGKDLLKTQKALGHKNLNSTVQYLSFADEDVDDAIAQDHPGACFNGIVPFSFWYFRRLPE